MKKISANKKERSVAKKQHTDLRQTNSHVRTFGLFADKEVARWRRKRNVEGEHLKARGRRKRRGKIGMLDERDARGARKRQRGEQSEVSATSVRARTTPLVHLAKGRAGRAPRRSSPRMRRCWRGVYARTSVANLDGVWRRGGWMK